MKSLKEFLNFNMKSIDNLYLDLVYEKLRLVENGYDQLLVEEQLWDIGKFILGNFGTAATQTIKGQLFEYLVGRLGIPTDSYISLAIKNLLANVPFRNYHKLLTDCDYLTSQLAKALIEAFIDQWRKSAGFDSLIHIALKELLVEAATKTNLYLKLQKKLVNIVCPLVKEFTGGIDMTVFKSAANAPKASDITKNLKVDKDVMNNVKSKIGMGDSDTPKPSTEK